MTSKTRYTLLPEFKGKRTLKILLRSAHLLAISGVCGAIFFNVTDTIVRDFWAAAIVTGLGLLALDALSNLIWFIQVRGFVIMIKLGLLTLIPFAPNWNILIIVTIVIISGVISHAPSHWRYYSIIHNRVIKSSRDIKG